MPACRDFLHCRLQITVVLSFVLFVAAEEALHRRRVVQLIFPVELVEELAAHQMVVLVDLDGLQARVVLLSRQFARQMLRQLARVADHGAGSFRVGARGHAQIQPVLLCPVLVKTLLLLQVDDIDAGHFRALLRKQGVRTVDPLLECDRGADIR